MIIKFAAEAALRTPRNLSYEWVYDICSTGTGDITCNLVINISIGHV